MERNKTNPTNRPTLADFGTMLADAVQDFGVIHHDKGRMDDEATSNEIIGRIGDLAEELVLSNISTTEITALFESVNYYTLTARDNRQREQANKAAEAFQRIISLWGLLKDYNSELWQFANASANYIKDVAIAAASEFTTSKKNTKQ